VAAGAAAEEPVVRAVEAAEAAVAAVAVAAGVAPGEPLEFNAP
jgi:hypothetical protein